MTGAERDPDDVAVASSNKSVPDWYPTFLTAVAECIDAGRRRAVAAANTELVLTYWAAEAAGWLA